METTKNIWCAKGNTAQLITVNKWFKKFRSGYKDLENQTRSCKPKIMDSEANTVSNTRRILGEPDISQ